MTASELKIFKELLGLSESSGRYDIVKYYNGQEYLGKYQFGKARMIDICKALNIKLPDRNVFLNDHELQEKFFNTHVALIEQELKSTGLINFIGKELTGKTNKITTKINIYGLIAGRHLGGLVGLKNYLIKGVDVKDDRTYISDYVTYFSYKMEEKKNSLG